VQTDPLMVPSMPNAALLLGHMTAGTNGNTHLIITMQHIMIDPSMLNDKMEVFSGRPAIYPDKIHF